MSKVHEIQFLILGQPTIHAMVSDAKHVLYLVAKHVGTSPLQFDEETINSLLELSQIGSGMPPLNQVGGEVP